MNSLLFEEYSLKFGGLNFTLARVPPEKMPEVERMMREALAGQRPPLTDADLGLDLPENAES